MARAAYEVAQAYEAAARAYEVAWASRAILQATFAGVTRAHQRDILIRLIEEANA